MIPLGKPSPKISALGFGALIPLWLMVPLATLIAPNASLPRLPVALIGLGMAVVNAWLAWRLWHE